MIRRFNYTGRRKIAKEHARISIRQADGVATFAADLSLKRYGFPAAARVFVEAFRQTVLMRFDWGTIGHPERPPRIALSEFASTEGLWFRVKVVDAQGNDSSPARILGLANKITPAHADAPADSDSLLPVVPAAIEDGHDRNPAMGSRRGRELVFNERSIQ
jgi:hypothetical protein